MNGVKVTGVRFLQWFHDAYPDAGLHHPEFMQQELVYNTYLMQYDLG